jgi:SAM-dependent methyltransferase/uncharacterized protein YbaR (Trm112 family)
MLSSLPPKLQCPGCWPSGAPLRLCPFRSSDTAGAVRDGVLICTQCGAWYAIDDHLLDLAPPELQNASDRAAFASRFTRDLQNANCSPFADGDAKETGSFDAQWKQRAHFDAFADSERQSYHTYARQPFWLAVDVLTYSDWARSIPHGSHLLDVGCANGRSSLYWARRGVVVTGFDISKKLVRQAIETARAEGLGAVTTFFVGDGRHPPLQDESFDNVLTYGALHHLPSPGAVCRDIQRVLVRGGRHFGSENNRSFLRGVFDGLMKLAPLWREEAGEQPLISQSMLRGWMDGLPAKTDARTMVYVPPHLCNLLGEHLSEHLLRLTDRWGARIRPLREHGGLLVFEIQKD